MNRAELSHLPPCAGPMHLSCLLLTRHHDLAHQTQLVAECCDPIEDPRRALCSLSELVMLFLIPCFGPYFVSTFRHLGEEYLPISWCLFTQTVLIFFLPLVLMELEVNMSQDVLVLCFYCACVSYQHSQLRAE